MKLKLMVFFPSTSLLMLPVGARGRPGVGSQGGGHQRPSQGQPSAGQGQGQHGSQMGKGTVQRDQKRIYATTEQRNQIRTCNQSADEIRQRARELARTAQHSGWQAGSMREQVTRLRQQFRSLQEEHNRLMQGQDAEQRAVLQERIRNMEQLGERVEAELSTIEGELANTKPDGKRIAGHVREIERYMKEWQEQYREMHMRMPLP